MYKIKTNKHLVLSYKNYLQIRYESIISELEINKKACELSNCEKRERKKEKVIKGKKRKRKRKRRKKKERKAKRKKI